MTRHGPVPLVGRLRELAADDPDHVVVTTEAGSCTRGELESDSDARARELVSLGVRPGDHVGLVLPDGVEFVSALLAVWKTGAVPVPLSHRLPEAELAGLLDLVGPRVVIGGARAHVGPAVHLPAGHRPVPHPEIELDRSVISPSWKAIGSGGSTGRPKVIVAQAPASVEAHDYGSSPLGIRARDVSLIPAPLSHNGPLVSLVHTLLHGGRVVLTGRFDAERTLATVQREAVTWLYLVPTMMSRIWKLPDEVRGRADLSSLRTVAHMAAPCPDWLKGAWVDWLGPDRLLEMYTSTEAVVLFVATGREWLERPGTVGLPRGGEVQVRSPEGDPLAPGQVGQVWVRRAAGRGPSYRYLGATARSDPHGWETLGDIGRLDEAGYLYITDRESDMLLVGGTNVYPAEIEAALLEHPAVADCCVVGLPSDDLGQAPHALVYATAPVDAAELTAHTLERLAPYKRPRSYEFVDAALRDAAGKVRRRQLQSARSPRDEGVGRPRSGRPRVAEDRGAPVPEPGPGDVLVRVQAVGINYPDGLLLRDRYQVTAPRPLVPGSEFCGVVERIGTAVTGVRRGDVVIGACGWGALAEYVLVPAGRVVAVPAHLPRAAAAAFLFTYATAYHALHDAGRLRGGETLLVLGAGGGLGSAAVDVGSALGARVIAAASTPSKVAFARERGAADGLVYSADLQAGDDQKALTRRLRELAHHGVDVALDPVGGHYTEPVLRALARGGRHLVAGFTAGIPRVPLNVALLSSSHIIGVDWRTFRHEEPAADARNVAALLALWQAGEIEPEVTELVPFDAAPSAIARLESRTSLGKIVVTVPP